MNHNMNTLEQEDSLFEPFIHGNAWDDANLTMFDTLPSDPLHPSQSQLNGLWSPSAPSPAVLEAKTKQHIREQSAFPNAQEDAKFQPRGSTTSSSSPDSSAQDSSSESSGKRKRKSSTLFSSMDNKISNSRTAGSYSSGPDSMFSDQSPLMSTETDVDAMSRDMTNHVNLFSAHNSPGHTGMMAGEQTIAPSKIENTFAPPATKRSQFILGGDSRDGSPTMTLSSETSPPAYVNQNSPHATNGDAFMSSASIVPPMRNNTWQNESSASPASTNMSIASPVAAASNRSSRHGIRFFAQPLQAKSRVETQITIRLIMLPLPKGISKLHLPRESISKSKNFAKEVARGPDTLELHTSVVCASALNKPGIRDTALRRAAQAAQNPGIKQENGSRRSSTANSAEDDPNDPAKPLNGGEVQICDNCVARERKRAARKRVKKPEDEETWTKFERERIVVFNEKEYKEWQPPAPPKEGSKEQTKYPDGSMIIEVPMRIACYCRHQGEKQGFQVIFTLTDHLDRLIAQSITSPVLITDDHKTHQQPAASSSHHASDMQPVPFQRPYHSTNDLQGLQNAMQPQFLPGGQPYHSHSTVPSGATSASMTPRNMSRQASPSAQTGANKRRKGSGSHHHRLPSGLTMTPRVDTQTVLGAGFHSAGASSATTPVLPPTGFLPHGDPGFVAGMPLTSPMDITPTTPGVSGLVSPSIRNQSSENLQQNFYSVPNSAHQSRSGSPVATNRHSMHTFHQPQPQPQAQPGHFINGVHAQLQTMAPNMEIPPAMPAAPAIHRILPSEGPVSGHTEVTCLGTGFTRDHEVMFGDKFALNTNYWSETTLIAHVPPTTRAGPVNVTVVMRNPNSRQFASPHQQLGAPQIYVYKDDTSDQLFKLALQVMAQQHGNMDSFRSMLVSMASQSTSNMGGAVMGGSYMGGPPSGQAGFHQMQVIPVMTGIVTEDTMLRCLDFLDLNENPEPPQFNMRTSSGATMMSLACSLGYTRFVAALLARGADPETRDKGGFTPLMMASMHGQPQIVRRLLLRGADSMTRNLRGYQAIDMAASPDVGVALQRMPHHQRTRSAGGSISRSRRNSIASIHSIWETPSNSSAAETLDGDTEDSDDSDATDGPGNAQNWIKSRRGSNATGINLPAVAPPAEDQHGFLHPASAASAAAAAAFNNMSAQMSASMSAQLQHFQQTFQRNFPNIPIQFPTLPNMPTMASFEGYQANAMVRRISNMVPHATSPRSDSAGSDKSTAATVTLSWRDLFSSSPQPPPAYEEIYPAPETSEQASQSKADPALHAELENVLDQKCAALFDTETSPTIAPENQVGSNMTITTSATLTTEDVGPNTRTASTILSKAMTDTIDIRYGSRREPTKEQQQRLQTVLQQKRTGLFQDWRLLCFWLPLLIAIILFTPIGSTLARSPLVSPFLTQNARVEEIA